jgi:hypothetical protein
MQYGNNEQYGSLNKKRSNIPKNNCKIIFYKIKKYCEILLTYIVRKV